MARSLRRRSTDAERKLWRWLRDRRFAHVKFRRQYPVGFFVIDFYSRPLKLAIELDGKGHLWEDKRIHDEKRDAYLARRGIVVLRIPNGDLQRDPQTVSLIIEAAISRQLGR